MSFASEEKLVEAFHSMWDNYPEQVRLIDRTFRVVAGNKAYTAIGGPVGVHCNEGDPAMHKGCQAQAALRDGESKSMKNEAMGIPMESLWVPVAGETDYYIHFTNGMNDFFKKLMEQQPPMGQPPQG